MMYDDLLTVTITITYIPQQSCSHKKKYKKENK